MCYRTAQDRNTWSQGSLLNPRHVPGKEQAVTGRHMQSCVQQKRQNLSPLSTLVLLAKFPAAPVFLDERLD